MFRKDLFHKDIVCHYTSKDNAISILEKKKIFLSPLASCDDPRESKQWNFGFIGEGTICLENYPIIPNKISSYIRNNDRVHCFCGWNDEKLDFSKNMVPYYREAYYRAGFAISRMWSQYEKGTLAFALSSIKYDYKRYLNHYLIRERNSPGVWSTSIILKASLKQGRLNAGIYLIIVSMKHWECR